MLIYINVKKLMPRLSKDKKQILIAIALLLCFSATSLIFLRNQAPDLTKASSLHAPIIP